MNKLLIRPYGQSDIESIINILEKVGWADQYIKGQKKAIGKLLEDEEGEVWVAVLSNQIVGYIQAQHHKWNLLSNLHGLVVSVDHRRQGIARKLVEHVENASQLRGNRGIYLDTPIINEDGRSFYKALGYKESYIMPEYYEPGLDGITYLKLFN
ncbi:MAG: GNAT family N-acetyltransferase [Alphaproteobacteria bacterium]|jgi:ribosomal protein S18 acetylase RimI-like enzyme|nr:GNAT family N-acetyltransferase [Alphaproteobacteria bacterium]